MNDQQKTYALISLYDDQKPGSEIFAKKLSAMGFSILSSGGTARYLEQHGLQGKVTDIAKITNYPAILGHRVVTLHPAIHGGILARGCEEDLEDMKEYDIARIGLVYVTLYPTWKALNDSSTNMDKVMDLVDIGGVTLLRAAAKNHSFCIPICTPEDCERVVNQLTTEGNVPLDMRKALVQIKFLILHPAMTRRFINIWQQKTERMLKQFSFQKEKNLPTERIRIKALHIYTKQTAMIPLL